jgi:hypothetical protein
MPRPVRRKGKLKFLVEAQERAKHAPPKLTPVLTPALAQLPQKRPHPDSDNGDDEFADPSSIFDTASVEVRNFQFP